MEREAKEEEEEEEEEDAGAEVGDGVGEVAEDARERDDGGVPLLEEGGGTALGSSLRLPTKMAMPSASHRAAMVFMAMPSISSAESSGT